ncbi:MAG: TonB-dependent receptor [Hyphomicrobium sp.]|nr:TonB-dependent receptor [Hyphomicrobium sp.]
MAQEPPTPAPPADQLPPVDVIQKQPTPAPAAKKKSAAKKKQVSPTPQPPAAVAAPAPTTINPNSVYGSPASTGAAQRAYESAITPVNPSQLIPTNLHGFSSSATHITAEDIAEREPRNVNEALTRVPGVIVINDDADAHHGGIGLRGSPPRRSRKMLVMEDGHTVNLALWLDPSVHYWAPIERMESVEVIRGTIITHGPNNNFGAINSRNLSPFGPDETVISSAIGFTRSRAGSFTPIEEIEVDSNGDVDIDYGNTVHGKSDTDISARWHVHTRQSVDNVGLVASYTGADVQGAWDTEHLTVHDFYGALGFKGSTSDLVVSAVHARQRDDYDEQNFLGSEIEIEFDDPSMATEENAARIAGGLAEQQFNLLKHCKTCYAPAAGLNTYTGEIWRGQIVHNAYLDENTTVTSRFYAGYHRRDRYQLVSTESEPDGTPGAPPVVGSDEVFFGEDSMFGRLRTFRHIGGEVRGEWANQNVLGFRQDFQAGIRYEYQDMTNRNVLGLDNEVLEDGNKGSATFFDRSLNANTVSAFLQSNIYVAKNFNVLPGVRFEWYDVNRRNRVVAAEEGEADEEDPCPVAPFAPDECLVIEDLLFDPDPARDSTSSFNALPGIAFAYTGFYRSTLYGGYHRGLTTNVLRNEDFPSPDEIGDNFNVGFRSSAIKGVDFEVAGFYQLFKDFQYGESFSAITGDREFGRADEVEISGVELYGRLNSQPFTGGPLNFFAEGNYTYARSILDKAFTYDDTGVIDDDFSGNRVPEVPWHVAALTLGVEGTTGWRWNASATWTYRGSFFTDAANTPFGLGGEYECDDVAGECEIEEAGEGGAVPSVWLLSARFNLDIGNTGASVFVAGDNLLDEFYITDREDGMKPGLGRTVWTGFQYKF